MGRGEEERRDGDRHGAPGGGNIRNGAAVSGNVHAVQAHLHAGNETGAKDLHASEGLRGSERGIGNQRIGDTADYAGARRGTRDDQL